MGEKSFAAASTFSVPDSMGMTQKKYLNETEAGAYLNISPEKVLSLITSGDINARSVILRQGENGKNVLLYFTVQRLQNADPLISNL